LAGTLAVTAVSASCNLSRAIVKRITAPLFTPGRGKALLLF
jgi:hypothetical protein